MGKFLMALLLLSCACWFAVTRIRRRFFADLKAPERRALLWERLYSWDWGNHTTNNYGYAPSSLDHPEKYQLELYRALFSMAETASEGGVKVLEISCGRGGGLSLLCRESAGRIVATGLDLSARAIEAAQQLHHGVRGLSFVQGSALSLPFEAASFDIVLNVEASHEYSDLERFLGEVRRVLKPGGQFLHCNSRTIRQSPRILRAFERAGFDGETRDITVNVADACRLDSARRLQLIRSAVPLFERALIGKWLGNYAALDSSRKFAQFQSGVRGYYMSRFRVSSHRTH